MYGECTERLCRWHRLTRFVCVCVCVCVYVCVEFHNEDHALSQVAIVSIPAGVVCISRMGHPWLYSHQPLLGLPGSRVHPQQSLQPSKWHILIWDALFCCIQWRQASLQQSQQHFDLQAQCWAGTWLWPRHSSVQSIQCSHRLVEWRKQHWLEFLSVSSSQWGAC